MAKKRREIKSSEETKVALPNNQIFDIAVDRLVDRKYLMKFMGISRSTLERLLKAGKFPQPHFKFGMNLDRWVLRLVAESLVHQTH